MGLISLENDGLWALTPKKCFVIQMPKEVHADTPRTNAPIALTERDIGTMNPIVARLLLQSDRLYNDLACRENLDQQIFNRRCVDLVEELLTCDAAHKTLTGQLTAIDARLSVEGLNTQNRGTVVMLPQVDGLLGLTQQFLVSAKRAIRIMCTLVATFLNVPDNNNNFKHLLAFIEKQGFGGSPFAETLAKYESVVADLIALRNNQEHPGETRTLVRNFEFVNENLVLPTWCCEGTVPRPTSNIKDDMTDSLRHLVDMSEEIIVQGLILRKPQQVEVDIKQIEEGQRDPNAPIRYTGKIVGFTG